MEKRQYNTPAFSVVELDSTATSALPSVDSTEKDDRFNAASFDNLNVREVSTPFQNTMQASGGSPFNDYVSQGSPF